MIRDPEYLIKTRKTKDKEFINQDFVELSSLSDPVSEGQVYTTDQLLGLKRNLLIVGPPGSGKTENLLHLFYVTSTQGQNVEESFIPIFLDILLLSQGKKIKDEISTFLERYFEKQLSDKRLLILVDGIDALPSKNYEIIINQLDIIANKCPTATILITSRPNDSRLHLLTAKFSILAIQEFNEYQIDKYLSRNFPDWRTTKERLHTNRITSTLMGNPLILRIIRQNFDVLSSQALLLDPTIIVEKLIIQSLQYISTTCEIGFDRLIQFFEYMAIYLHVNEKQFLTDSEFISISEHLNIQYRNIVDSGIRSSILIRSHHNTISFGHILLFEYFLTKYIRKIIHEDQGYQVINRYDDVLIGLRILDVRSIETVEKIFKTFEHLVPISRNRIIPLYARSGSLVVALAICGAAILAYGLRKYADAFLAELGKNTASKLINRKDKIKLPKEIHTLLPYWISKNSQALNIFTEELIKHHAQNTYEMLTDPELTKIWIKSKLIEKYGSYIEELNVEEIINRKLE